MTGPSTRQAETEPAQQAPRRQGAMLAVLLAAIFVAQFDFFVVNVAAPSLARDLHTGPGALELIVGGYAFAYAGGMITGGRLGDLFGYRRLFVFGMLSFTVASLLCGISLNPTELVLARLVQGGTAAVLVPQVLAVITAVVPVAARPRVLGWYGAAAGLGSIGGQVLGGLLLTADVLGLGWRVIFLINVPVGLVASVLAARLLPRVRPPRRSRLDLVGAAGIALSLALALVPLTLGHSKGWPLWTWISLALAVPATWATAHWLRRLRARGGMPVLDLDLLRVPFYLAGLGANIAFMLYFGSFMFTLTLLLQSGLGLTALGAGLAFLPMGLLFTATALLGPALMARYGLRVVVFGGLVTALGLLLSTLHLGAAPDLAWLVGALALVGAGNGFVLPRLIGAALVRVRPERAGIGSAMLSTAQQFASAAGVALIGGVFFVVLGSGEASGRYPVAMRASALCDIALSLVVLVTVAWHQRASRSANADRAERSVGQ